MQKNKDYTMEIEDIGNDGEGIGRLEGMAVFVKDTVIGDVAKVKIIKLKKNYAYGRLMEIITPSAFRVEPICTKSKSCGGCTLMHMDYTKQLEYKNNKVVNCLKRIGGIDNPEELMEPIIGMEYPFEYRNKMQLPVRTDKDGKLQIGFFAGRTHSIIDLKECHIGHPINKFIIKALRTFMEQNQISAYNEETGKGIVRHILTRVGFTTNEIMVCLVINGNKLPFEEKFLHEIQGAIEEYNLKMNAKSKEQSPLVLCSISLNINKENTNRILGDKVITIFGKEYITDYIGNVKFQISPLSFYQVNPVQTKVLYEKALEYAELRGKEVVWDMYCGIGTISLFLAQKAKRVYGVEIIPEAIEDARKNARINNIDNVEFFVGKAEEVVPREYEQDITNKKASVVVVDPPRKGCDSKLLETLIHMSPDKIVYVSCDPATLARDIKILCQGGYELRRGVAVDQFGHSGHVESVCLMTRNK